MKYADEWFHLNALKNGSDSYTKRVYLATDEPTLIEETKYGPTIYFLSFVFSSLKFEIQKIVKKLKIKSLKFLGENMLDTKFTPTLRLHPVLN